jgi:hypothetical protein
VMKPRCRSTAWPSMPATPGAISDVVMITMLLLAGIGVSAAGVYLAVRRLCVDVAAARVRLATTEPRAMPAKS